MQFFWNHIIPFYVYFLPQKDNGLEVDDIIFDDNSQLSQLSQLSLNDDDVTVNDDITEDTMTQDEILYDAAADNQR